MKSDLDELRLHLREELVPAPRQRGKYFCPLCGSGTGARKSAAFSIMDDGIHGHCFSCGFHGDLFDLISKRYGVSLSEATRIAKGRYSTTPYRAKEAAPARKEQQVRDFAAEIRNFHSTIWGSEGEAYLLGRGITKESIERFSLGYDPQRKQIIIPYDTKGSYYGMRSIVPAANVAHLKPAGVTAPMFNAAALAASDPCFVVESPLCAISIMQEGGNAVALGGTNIELLQRHAQKKKPTARLLLCLDNDKPKEDGRCPGQEAQRKLAAWLAENGIPYTEANVAGAYKDPNEALQAEPEAFRARIRSAVEDAQGHKDAQYMAYIGEAASGAVEAFLQGVSESASTPPIPTGYRTLDKLLDGGLYEGLYIVGAISSLGKTSFVLQMCDQIAAAGHDVLFFSLEMGKFELMAKSISRRTKQYADSQGLPSRFAKTTRGILSGQRYAGYSEQEIKAIAAAVDGYKEQVSGRIWFVEGVGNIGAAAVRDRVEQHIRVMGQTPVVVVDYLQIMASSDPRLTDKQNTDKNVLELKRLSRDCKLPVIGISSLNRDNYTEPINTAAFKESGAIEYGADCLIGLQYSGMEWREGEKEQDRLKRIREMMNENDNAARKGEAVQIEVKVMKNRNGGRGMSDPLDFFPMFNLFQETPSGYTRVNVDTPFTQKRI